ncbi:MAG: glucose 1-dehydrogenase [Chloroflexi bacterium]|nr:glucose 1-dehydrogenase [Chloroflexota bacterium]
MRLQDKSALISGGARGIGAAIARLFAEHGASVAFGDVLEEEGRQVEAEIQETGAEALFIPLDVSSEEAWQTAIAATVERFGKLDVLVNNAGIRGEGGAEDTSVESWDAVMAVNARGVFLGTKLAIPEMRRAGGGSIINISSQMGMVGSDTSGSAYHASKGAVRAFTKSAAIRHAREGIRVNSVHPGPILTPFTEGRMDIGAPNRELYISRIPMGRIGTAEEVAYGVLYLASDESSFVTGSELVIDGGWIAQ